MQVVQLQATRCLFFAGSHGKDERIKIRQYNLCMLCYFCHFMGQDL